tara:strand:- start:341 stop:568 length:228 start_codon:yes stop_codon:yes gene_type:complete
MIKKYGANPEEDRILSSVQCREIVQEILNFGVDQYQMLIIIKLLSLELEDRNMMLQLTEVIDSSLENESKPTIEI